MKKLLVLAGGSARNQAWGEGCVAAYGPWFDEVVFPHYTHWATGEKNVDFPVELAKIKEVVQASGASDEWFIIAKSIGSILSTKATAEGIITPQACVFFGMPINLVVDSVFAGDLSPLSSLTMPVMALHNRHDPTALYDVTAQALVTHAPSVQLVTLEGDTHDYLDFARYSESIKLHLGV